MTGERASRTAEYMAFFRALESGRPAAVRLFDDPFATHFLRPALRWAASAARRPLLGALVTRYADRRLPGARTSGIARTRVIDDAVRRLVREGVPQVVILGAGFDCRAYRLPELAAITVFELDQPVTQTMKLACLRRQLPALPANVRFVPIDFTRERLPDVLASAGFDRHRPAVFIWEGVTNYLSAAAVDAVLRYVATCAPRTHLIFTYVHRGALDDSVRFEDAPAIRRDVARLGEPWTFGLHPDEVAAYLRERGLRLEHDVGAHEYRVQCFGASKEQMKGYDFYRVAVAEVTGPERGSLGGTHA